MATKTRKRTNKKSSTNLSNLLRHLTAVRLLIVVTLVAILGTSLLLFTRANAQVAVGSQFHCTWGSYTDAQRTAVLDKLAAAKLSWVRIDVGWSSFQETSRTTYSQWYVDRTDFCVNQAVARGLKVLLTVHRTPGWANGGQATGVPPTDLNDYANFAYWISNHYKGKVSAYEVWNEPDPSQSFWQGTASQYVDMLKLAYPKFKAGDPNAKVVLGAPSSNDDAWIGQVYNLGAKNYFDVMATHPYQGLADQPPEYPDDNHKWWLTHFPAVLNVMKQYGDGAKEVWFTEFGWSSHDNTSSTPNWQRGVTLQQQGDYFVRAVKHVQANYPNVTHLFWYNERNRTDSNIQVNNYGLLNADLSEKPAYLAIKSYLSSLLGTPDTTAPTASITNPTNSSNISGTAAVSAAASDNQGVTKVELYVDGALFATSALSPYSFSWNSASFTNGSHSLQAKAYDGAGNVGQSQAVTVNVSNTTSSPTNDTIAPSVTIVKPLSGDIVGNKTSVYATATDNIGVTSMVLLVDGKTVSASTTGKLSVNWNTRKLSPGSHTIVVQALDAKGNVGSASIIVVKQ